MPHVDPLHALQAAARSYGQHVLPGVQIERVIVVAAGGVKIASVAVPLCGPPAIVPVAAEGWDFAPGETRFDGVLIPIHGQKLALLKVLAEADGPLTVEQLKVAWLDGIAEDGTIRWTLGELRKALKLLFPGLDDPITSGPEGYSLALR